MKKQIIGLLISGLLISNFIAISPASGEDRKPKKIFSGWITDYSIYGDTTKGQLQAIDYVIEHADMYEQILPFWYTLTSASKIKDKYVTQNSIDKSIPISTLQSLRIKVIPTITDSTGEGVLSKIMSKAEDRAILIKTISDLVAENNFDGIDLNFEGFAYVDKLATWPTIQPRWVTFVRELSQVLHSQNKLLSVTTPVLFDPTTGKKGYYFYAWPEISDYIDRLNIMAYDFHKYNTDPGPIGPINWFEPALIFALKSIAPWKIYIGTPNYGYNWVTKVDGTCPTNTPASEKKSSNAAIIHQLRSQAILDKPGAVATYNEKYGETNVLYTAEFTGTTSSNIPTSCSVKHSVWYVDAMGYSARARLVEKYGLGGISEWETGYGDSYAIEEVRKIALEMGQDKVVGDVASSATVVNYGQDIEFTGSFKLADGQPIADAQVFLEVKRASGNLRREVSKTLVDGSFTTKILLGESAGVSFTTDATLNRTMGNTPQLQIDISHLISWKIPSAMKRGVTYKVVGEVQPRSADINVYLESGDTTIATTTDLNGSFEIEIMTSKKGVIEYWIATDAKDGFIGSKSNLALVLIR
ncbi:MAG: glycosyl hydrolase family 18 protein [Actinomycetota bacterium]